MRPRVIKRPPAKRDLLEQASYLAQDKLNAAARFLSAAEEAFRLLARMPAMGSRRNFANPRLAGLRLWRVPGFEMHLIFYRPIPGGIEVLRVLHGSRDVQSILEDRAGPRG